MDFSVIVPSLNSSTIDRTLAALEYQQFDRRQYEVIVVGLDQENRVRESDVIRFFSEGPLSPARARNRGAAQARGGILAFTDADGIPDAQWLAVFKRKFANPHVTVLGGGIEFASDNYWQVADNLSMFHDYFAGQASGRRSQLPSLNLAIRRDVFFQVGGFDERYPRPAGEDADLTIRLRQAGHTLWFEPQAVVRHAPPRLRFVDVWRHAFYQGQYSTKVDVRYRHSEGLPWPFYTRFGVLLAAPLLATLATVNIFKFRSVHPYWSTFPMIWLAKIAWCLGAAAHPERSSDD